MSSSDFLPQAAESGCGAGGASVPVFNCIVFLTPDASTGRLSARVANLPGITAEGNAERELLIVLTKQFKTLVQECIRENRPIPWIDPPEVRQAGEQQRLIPVHL